MITSFISEHTAELILLPDILKILYVKYGKISPFYYWASREGGRLARHSFHGQKVRLLAFYPRRPKVSGLYNGAIQVKINELLIHRNHYLTEQGIAVIAGVPLADKFDSIHAGTSCVWFDFKLIEEETVFNIDLVSKLVSNSGIKTLSPDEIVDIVERSSTHLTWTEALNKIKEMGRSSNQQYHGWNRMSGDLYKPTYLVIHSL